MPSRRFMRIFKYHAVFMAVLLITGLNACNGDNPEQSEQQEAPPSKVSYQEVHKTDVQVFRQYPARVHGSRTVQVRSRVEGILEEKLYQEGEVVSKGDELFVIDQEPFEIALRQARADLEDARAGYDHARRDWKRYSRLYEQGTVSEQTRDEARTEYQLAGAAVSRAEANVEDARRNLRYTRVSAPVDGITGMEDVSEGNLLSWGDLLTTMTRNDPVHVRFSIPQEEAVARRMAAETGPEEALPPKSLLEGARVGREGLDVLLARLMPDRDQKYPHKGVVDFTASTVDPDTGEVAYRAVFANPDQELMPGQFVRVRLLLQNLEDVFLVPESAVGQDREGPMVFVLDEDNVARVRHVRLGPVLEDGWAVFEGLQEKDRVVVNGQVALEDGAQVQARPAENPETK